MSARKRPSGFTLIELMMVVAIIGLLASVAIPAFQGYIRDARMVEADTGLQKMTSAVSAYYQATDMAPATWCGGGFCNGSGWAPFMWPGDTCLNYGGVYPQSSMADFNVSWSWWNVIPFAPEGRIRFQYGGWADSWQGHFQAFLYVYGDPMCSGHWVEKRMELRRMGSDDVQRIGPVTWEW